MEKHWIHSMVHTIPESGCWIWEGGKSCDRYGQTTLVKGTTLAHRASWILHNGAIPHGMSVLHKCDTRPCVNPDHLWLGTAGDNNRDAFAKNRQTILKGTQRIASKLDDNKVREIIQRRGKATQKQLAAEYGVDQSVISEVQTRKIWKHVEV